MSTDPIADMLTIIRNACLVQKPKVSVPYSKIKFGIALILKKEGYVRDVIKKRKGFKKIIEIFLKYDENGFSAIRGLKRISKPGRRVYLEKKKIFPVKKGYGFSIVSTSKGLLTDKEARKKGVGGEIIAEIW